jgi:hypothetical protein
MRRLLNQRTFGLLSECSKAWKLFVFGEELFELVAGTQRQFIFLKLKAKRKAC